MTLERENFRETYGQHLFGGACFSFTRKSRFRVVMLKGREGCGELLSLANIVILLRLRSRREAEGREVAGVTYMEVKAPLDAVEKIICYNCVRWSPSNKMHKSVCDKEH